MTLLFPVRLFCPLTSMATSVYRFPVNAVGEKERSGQSGVFRALLSR